MSQIAFLHPWGLGLLLLLPAVSWLFRWADRKRADALRKFSPLQGAGLRVTRSRFVILAALGFVVAAIAEPVWRENSAVKPASGVDIVFLLDVSRSMLTRDGLERDRAVSRIEAARVAINEVMSHAADERFALVVFAGNSSVECPLTNDYDFLRGQLKSASRESVTLGGSRPGDAIRFAARTAFDDASHNARELILISDGGDEDSAPDGAAAELEKRHIRLVVAGVGDAAAPGFVPESEMNSTPILYRGKPVTAKPDGAALQRICGARPRCTFVALPNAAFEKTVFDRGLQSRADLNAASMGGSVLALIAAALLAGEGVVWRRRR